MRKDLAAVLVAWLGIAMPAAAQTPIPARTAWVTDRTGTLDAANIAKIDDKLARYVVSSGNEVAVLLVPGTGTEPLEEYAQRVVEAWHLGGAGRRGAVLVWSAEGMIGMGVGAGLADVLTPEVQSQIERAWIIPRFGNGDPDGGIAEGAEHIVRVLQGQRVIDDDDAAATAGAAALLGLAPPSAEDTAASPSAEPEDEEDASQNTEPEDEEEAAQYTEPGDEEEASQNAEPREESETPRGADSMDDAETPPGAKPAGEESNPLLEKWSQEVAGILDRFQQAPWATLNAVSHEAGDQLLKLPAALGDSWSARANASALPEPVRVAQYVLGGVAIVVLLAVLARSLRFAALIIGVPGAAALWLVTGFTALSLALPIVAIVFMLLLPVLRPIVKEILRRPQDDDEEDERRRREAVLAAVSRRPPMRSGRQTTGAKGASTEATTPPRSVAGAVSPMARIDSRSAPPPFRERLTPSELAALQKFPELLRLAQRIDAWAPALARVKPWQVAAAIVLLFILHPALGVLGFLVAMALLVLQKGGVALESLPSALMLVLVRSRLRAK